MPTAHVLTERNERSHGAEWRCHSTPAGRGLGASPRAGVGREGGIIPLL